MEGQVSSGRDTRTHKSEKRARTGLLHVSNRDPNFLPSPTFIILAPFSRFSFVDKIFIATYIMASWALLNEGFRMDLGLHTSEMCNFLFGYSADIVVLLTGKRLSTERKERKIVHTLLFKDSIFLVSCMHESIHLPVTHKIALTWWRWK